MLLSKAAAIFLGFALNQTLKRGLFMWHFIKLRHRILFLFGITGLIIFFTFWAQLPLSDGSEVAVNRQNAIELSHQFLNAFGYSTANYQAEYAYSTDNLTRWYLQKKFERMKAREIIGERTPLNDGWKIRLFNPDSGNGESDSFELLISPMGKLRQWIHLIPNDAPGARRSPEEALQITNKFVLTNKILDVEQYRSRIRTLDLQNRTDHYVNYVRYDSTLETNLEYTFILHGDSIAGFSTRFMLPNESIQEFEAQQKFQTGIEQLFLPVLFLILIWLIFEFSKHDRTGIVESKNTGRLFLIMFIAAILESLNEIIPTVSRLEPGEVSRIWIYLFSASQRLLREDFILIIFVILGFIVGRENLRAKNKMQKLFSADVALENNWISINVAEALITGFLGAGILLGISTGLAWILVEGFGAMPDPTLFHTAFDKFFPWLTPLFKSLEYSLVMVFGVFLFVFTSAEKYIKHKIAGILAVIVIIELSGFYEISFFPVHWNIVFNLLIGTALLFMAIRFDYLTLLTTFVVYGMFLYALPLLHTTNAFLVLSGFSASILAFSILFFGFLGFKSLRKISAIEKKLPTSLNNLIQQEKLNREWDIARNIQHNLLPPVPPQISKFDSAGICLPAKEVSGNFFELFQKNSNELIAAICDISNIGIKAAFVLSLLKGMLRGIFICNESVKPMLLKLNNLILSLFSSENQVILFLARFDAESSVLDFVNHQDFTGFLYHSETQELLQLEENDFYLGGQTAAVLENKILEKNIELKPNDLLMVSTSGFVKAANKSGEQFGKERLKLILEQNSYFSARQLILNLASELERFLKGEPLKEDISMIVVRVRN